MPLTAQEVASEISSKNFQRGDAPKVPDMIQAAAEEKAVYIINVGPKSWLQEMGGRGKFFIPAKSEDQDYSVPLKIPGIFPETIPVDMKKLEVRYEDGLAVARDIIGLGHSKSPANSLIPWGVFISATAKPSKAELDRANRTLDEKAAQLVEEADGFYNQGPQQYVNITIDHRWAANRTNQKRAWMQPLVKMDNCPGCQEPLKPGVVVHTCGAVLDWDKAISLGIKKASDRPVKAA